MTDQRDPKLYLISPKIVDLEGRFLRDLSTIFEQHDIACLRLSLQTQDDGVIGKVADRVRDICHQHDVVVVIENHMLLVEKFGLDGVHLNDGSRNVTKARKLLGSDAIVGSYCAASRHAGLSAGEAGADYISFGPLSGAQLNDGTVAEADLFQWWSEMIEIPVIAEGNITQAALANIAPWSDFLAFGDEIWQTEEPAKTLSDLLATLPRT